MAVGSGTRARLTTRKHGLNKPLKHVPPQPPGISGPAPKLADVNESAIYKMAMIGCTLEEMALVAGLGKPALIRRFEMVINQGRANGHKTLRRKQWHAAMKGNVTMLMFLGKNMLGQSEKVTVNGALMQEVGVTVKTPAEVAAAMDQSVFGGGPVTQQQAQLPMIDAEAS